MLLGLLVAYGEVRVASERRVFGYVEPIGEIAAFLISTLSVVTGVETMGFITVAFISIIVSVDQSKSNKTLTAMELETNRSTLCTRPSLRSSPRAMGRHLLLALISSCGNSLSFSSRGITS